MEKSKVSKEEIERIIKSMKNDDEISFIEKDGTTVKVLRTHKWTIERYNEIEGWYQAPWEVYDEDRVIKYLQSFDFIKMEKNS